MFDIPESGRVAPEDYFDSQHERFMIETGDDPERYREIGRLSESLGWFVYAHHSYDETAGGDVFPTTDFSLVNESDQDLEEVLGLGFFDNESLRSLLDFFEPHLRKMKARDDLRRSHEEALKKTEEDFQDKRLRLHEDYQQALFDLERDMDSEQELS